MSGRSLGRGLRLDADRRHPHLIAYLKSPLRRDPPTVYPHLATAHDPVNPAAWNAGQQAQQKPVETLASALRINFNELHALALERG